MMSMSTVGIWRDVYYIMGNEKSKKQLCLCGYMKNIFASGSEQKHRKIKSQSIRIRMGGYIFLKVVFCYCSAFVQQIYFLKE